jgi:hypothetical protein
LKRPGKYNPSPYGRILSIAAPCNINNVTESRRVVSPPGDATRRNVAYPEVPTQEPFRQAMDIETNNTDYSVYSTPPMLCARKWGPTISYAHRSTLPEKLSGITLVSN